MGKILNCEVHTLEFPDIYSKKTFAGVTDLKTQYDKFFEEVQEMENEKEDIFTDEFRMELLDVIASGLNLYKCLTLYMKEGNKNYMAFANKINGRLSNGQLKIRK